MAKRCRNIMYLLCICDIYPCSPLNNTTGDLIKAMAGKIPILGVCMGHECVVETYDGVIEHCGEIVHGKTSNIVHDGKGLYTGIPNNIPVIRYHSLAARHTALPKGYIVTSRTAGISLFKLVYRMALSKSLCRWRNYGYSPYKDADRRRSIPS